MNGKITYQSLSIPFLMILVAVVSYMAFINQSLRLDEAQSIWQTGHSLPTMIQIIGQDVHVPLYHFLLHYWQMIFGNNAVFSRSLSLFFYILAIPVIYIIGARFYGRSVGLFAAILSAVSPFLNWYGNEVRMYSLFVLMTLLNNYFYLRIYQKGRGEYAHGIIWFGYIFSACLGIFTHYFFVFNLAAQAIFFLFYKKDFAKSSVWGFLLSAGLLGIIYAPWVLYVISLGSANNTQPHLSPPSSVDLFNTFSQFMFGFQVNAVNTFLVSLWPLLVLLLFLAVRRRNIVPPVSVFFFLNLCIPVVLAFLASSFWKPLYLSRYLILALPPLYFLISWLISIYGKRTALFVRVGLVSVMVVTLWVEAVNANTPVKEDYRAASEYIQKYAAAQDAVIVSAPFTIYPFLYYYHGPAQVETLPAWDHLKTGSIPDFSQDKLVEQTGEIEAHHEVIWLLLSYDQGYEEDIRMYFDTHLERLTAVNFSPGLNLYAYRVDYVHTKNYDFDFPGEAKAVAKSTQ